MKRPDTIIIEGRAYSWRALVALRKAQLYYTNGKDYRPAWMGPLPEADRGDGFGLGDEAVPGVAAGVEDVVAGLEDAV